MRIITNTKLIENRVKWARRIASVGMISLVIGFIINLQSISDPNLSVIALVLLFVGLVSTMISSNLVNDWLREPRADQFLANTLKRFGNDYILYSYTLSTLNILQTPSCLYIITVKNQAGEITVNGSDFKQKLTWWATISRFFTTNGVGSPATELLKSVEKVRQQLQTETSEPPLIYPLIVFSNKEAKLTINNPTVPVLHHHELRAYLKDNASKRAMSNQQSQTITQILGGSYQEISKGAE